MEVHSPFTYPSISLHPEAKDGTAPGRSTRLQGVGAGDPAAGLVEYNGAT